MPYKANGNLKEFLKRLPKTETHLHIEGALPWHLLHELDPERFPDPPDSWEDGYKFKDFAHFEGELLNMAGAWYTSPERYHEAACIIFNSGSRSRVETYLEPNHASNSSAIYDNVFI